MNPLFPGLLAAALLPAVSLAQTVSLKQVRAELERDEYGPYLTQVFDEALKREAPGGPPAVDLRTFRVMLNAMQSDILKERRDALTSPAPPQYLSAGVPNPAYELWKGQATAVSGTFENAARRLTQFSRQWGEQFRQQGRGTQTPGENPVDDTSDPGTRGAASPLDPAAAFDAGLGEGPGAGDSSGGAPLRQGIAPGLKSAEVTVARAAGQGAALKGSLNADDGLAGPAGAGGQFGNSAPGRDAAAPAAGAAGFPVGGAGALNLADPQSPQDLALAASGAFRESARALGLRAGAGSDGRPALLGPGGVPATPAQVAQFRERVQSEPAALTQFPNLFDPAAGGIERSQFQDLKSDFANKPEMRDKEFKHVAITEKERDFVRSQSCEKASGECNESAEKSYKKDEFVPPPDLKAMWKKAREAYRETAKAARAARATLGGSRLSLGRVGERLKRFFGGALSEGSGGGETGTLLAGSAAPAYVGGGPPRAEAVSAGRSRQGLGARPASEPVFPAKKGPPGWWVWLMTVALGLAVLTLARR